MGRGIGGGGGRGLWVKVKLDSLSFCGRLCCVLLENLCHWYNRAYVVGLKA